MAALFGLMFSALPVTLMKGILLAYRRIELPVLSLNSLRAEATHLSSCVCPDLAWPIRDVTLSVPIFGNSLVPFTPSLGW